jgi:hypothetical protein
MKPQYSPGPWSLDILAYDVDGKHVVHSGLTRIAEVLSLPSKSETEANAGVIATAPQMFESLQSILKWWDAQPQSGEEPPAIRRARMVIIRAKPRAA